VQDKSLNIIGGGAGNTIVTNGAIELINSGSRISGFTFTLQSNYHIVNYSQAWRFDHNTMSETTWGDMFYLVGSAATATEGLIDNNNITNGRVVFYGEDTSTGGMHRWAEPLDLGTNHAVYVEDNVFINQSNGCGVAVCNFIDSNLGGRIVARFNTVTNHYVEIHSIQGGGIRAARLNEVYENSFNISGVSGYIRTSLLRGGALLYFLNTFNGNWNSPGFDVDNVRTCRSGHPDGDFGNYGVCDGTGSVDGNQAGKDGYLCRDQPGASTDSSLWNGAGSAPSQLRAPWYIFKNVNGTNEIPWGYNACTDTTGVDHTDLLKEQIVSDRDIYSYIPSFSGVSGVGYGTIAGRPSTCTTGVAYWATDQGEWNSRHAGPDGQLYQCSATNTWSLYYTPYTYPHPLQSGSAGPTGPAAPTGLQATVN